MAEYRYTGLKIRQSESQKELVLFAAPASDIQVWSGVPQKKSFGEGAETTGFQREANEKRIDNLRSFFLDSENIVQNPLLCATRTIGDAHVSFDMTEGTVGEVIITLPDYESMSLLECLKLVRTGIEGRLIEVPTANSRLEKLRELAHEAGHSELETAEPEDDDEGVGDVNDGEQDAPAIESALFEESHLLDFWEDVDARVRLIEELGPSFSGNEFLGFTKDAILSYLKPAVLVDGQHRLRGAVEAANSQMEQDPWKGKIESKIDAGEDPSMVRAKFLEEVSRILPISMLLSDDPEEQIFQFVIVNQKATPIGKALLGTIVSTTLSDSEMSKVSERLINAGIEVEESKSITFMSRFDGSPFCGLVERGLVGDEKDLLKWNVLGGLINLFRHLKGGILYGQNNDYADKWKRKYLDSSGVVAQYSERGFSTPMENWSSDAGPWREVFMRFYALVREKFGDTSDNEKSNHWGRPRNSNLFNKISLTILAADFFQYLTDVKSKIDSVDNIDNLFDEWLEDVNFGYFDKDWDLAGVKKDSAGIRKQWAQVWYEYRKSPEKLPRKNVYRVSKKD